MFGTLTLLALHYYSIRLYRLVDIFNLIIVNNIFEICRIQTINAFYIRWLWVLSFISYFFPSFNKVQCIIIFLFFIGTRDNIHYVYYSSSKIINRAYISRFWTVRAFMKNCEQKIKKFLWCIQKYGLNIPSPLLNKLNVHSQYLKIIGGLQSKLGNKMVTFGKSTQKHLIH